MDKELLKTIRNQIKKVVPAAKVEVKSINRKIVVQISGIDSVSSELLNKILSATPSYYYFSIIPVESGLCITIYL
ncbi:MAG: hypothetical protein ACTSR0_04170 [Candidatus Asgardarchaeia archaeon]